jgi:hypothetical protein
MQRQLGSSTRHSHKEPSHVGPLHLVACRQAQGLHIATAIQPAESMPAVAPDPSSSPPAGRLSISSHSP